MFKKIIYDWKLNNFYKRLAKKYKYYKKHNIPFPTYIGTDFNEGDK